MLFNLFGSREVKVKTGDYAIIRRDYEHKFPNVSAGLVLKVDQIDDDQATVVFINANATHVCREALPIKALKKVG